MALNALKEAVTARATRAQAWAKEIETLSAGKIEAVVDPEGDITAIREAIDIVAAKTGSQEATRIRELDEGLCAHGLWTFLDRLRADCFLCYTGGSSAQRRGRSLRPARIC